MAKKTAWRNNLDRIIKILSHPGWNGVAGLIALLGALVALIGFVLPFIRSLSSRTQNITLWLSEPLAVPRYIMVSGTILLIAIIIATIQHYLSSHAKFSPLQELSRRLEAKGTGRVETKSKFLTIPVPMGTGNAYLQRRYLDLPPRIVIPNGVEFQFEPDYLLLDTNEQLRLTIRRDDGFREFGFPLPDPIQNVRTVYFLINSGNSLGLYRSVKVGEIKLIFRDVHPFITELVLGKNIREWCVGNRGDLVREVSDHTSNNLAWQGVNVDGTPAVIDYLRIQLFEYMTKKPLEQIIFRHNPEKRSPDTLGVHFSVFAISLEVE